MKKRNGNEKERKRIIEEREKNEKNKEKVGMR